MFNRLLSYRGLNHITSKNQVSRDHRSFELKNFMREPRFRQNITDTI